MKLSFRVMVHWPKEKKIGVILVGKADARKGLVSSLDSWEGSG